MIVPHSYGHFQFIVPSAGYFFPPATFFNDVVVSPRVLLSLRIERGSNTCTPVNVCAYTQTWCRQCSHVFSLPPLSRPHERKLLYAHVSPRADLLGPRKFRFCEPRFFSHNTIPHRTRECMCIRTRATTWRYVKREFVFHFISARAIYAFHRDHPDS